jgi:hypothetical protein
MVLVLSSVGIDSLLLGPLEDKRQLGHLDDLRVRQYMEDLDTCDPILVYESADERIVVNGYHRLEAAIRLGRTEIRADLQPGTRYDATLYLDGHGS